MDKRFSFFMLALACTATAFFSCNNNAAVTANGKIDTARLAAADSGMAGGTAAIAEKDTPGILINTDTAAFDLLPQHIVLQKGIELDLNIPQGYQISVAAEGLRRLRFLSKSPDGRLFATDMFDKSDNKRGRVYSFSDWDSTAHRFRKTTTFLDKLHNPNQVAFYSRNDSSFIYIAETGRLSYYYYRPGDSIATGKPAIIATFPDYGLSYKYGGWHLTRSIAFHRNKLYVSIGSSCNACIEKESIRATILEMNPDGTDSRIFASGLRNSVGIKWIGNQLWATSMGRDLIGPDKPEELLLQVSRNTRYHWPYYYQYLGSIYPDTQMQDSASVNHSAIPPVPPLAFAGFKAHTAPLGLDHFGGFSDAALNNAMVVALHGSTSVWRQRGNAIVKANGSNQYTAIVDGFLTGKTDKERKGRPCDVLMNDQHSFFFTDDHQGVLYYVWKK